MHHVQLSLPLSPPPPPTSTSSSSSSTLLPPPPSQLSSLSLQSPPLAASSLPQSPQSPLPPPPPPLPPLLSSPLLSPSSLSSLSQSQLKSQFRRPSSILRLQAQAQKQQLFHEFDSTDTENRWMQDVIEKIPVRARSQSWLIRTRHLLDDTKEKKPFISSCLYVLSVILVVITFPFCLPFCFKIIREYERAVVMRLGRLISGGTKGPGLFLLCLALIHFMFRDSVTVSVEAVIYFRINNPVISVTNVNDAKFSTKLLAQTTLRNVLGTRTLSEMLSERDNIANVIEKVLEEGTEPWGVEVQRVEIKDIRLPCELMRSMAAEAGAARDARSLIILADGERQASWLTLTHVASEHNSTIVIPIPMEVAKYFAKKWNKLTSKDP
ncbi:Mechanosensory protein 2 [Dirofilaria immitis]|nr:Mechanosensory protein 2 [Dirofilaria immitis]